VLSKFNFKQLFSVAALIATSATGSIAQSNSPTYEDDLIRARGIGASFSQDNKSVQASVIIENKSGKDLFLAVEYRGNRVISDLGGSSECNISGIKEINGVPTDSEPKPLLFSRLKPKARATISLTACQGITASSKPNSISVSLPFVILDNEKYSNLALNINGIPIGQKSKNTVSANPQSETIYFRTPSSSNYCVIGENGVSCQVKVNPDTIPPKPLSCKNNWGGRFSLGLQGKGARICYSDSLVNSDSIVLKYNTSIKSNGITCTAKKTDLTCINKDRKGWELSRERQRFF
jgi:hypothetical protein